MVKKDYLMGQQSKTHTAGVPRRFAGWCVAVFIVMFTLWQGSYFPLQFLLMLALMLIAFILFGNSLSVSKEALLFSGISLLYFVSLLILSENIYAGTIEALRTLIFPFALILFNNTDTDRIEKPIITALLLVAILGLLSFFSIIHLPGAVTADGNRLQSVIQYANTTALLMLIGTLYSLESFIKEKNIPMLCCCAVFLTTLALTGSRTVFIIAIAVCALYAVVKTSRRGRIITVTAVTATVLIVVLLGVLTDIRLFRISLREPTLVERFITYGDALNMVRGNLLLGIGTGNWPTWQFMYQSAPYSVFHIHNYYLKLLLNGGLLAPVLFIAATVPAVIRGIKEKNVHALILLAILLNAALDFDLAFASVAVVAMYSLSHLTSGKISPRTRYILSISVGKVRFVALVPLIVIAGLWVSEIFSANAESHRAAGDLSASMRSNEIALTLNPLNTALHYQMALSSEHPEQMEKHLQAAIKNSPRDLRALSALAILRSDQGSYFVALELFEILVGYRPHSADLWAMYLNTARRAAGQGVIETSELDVLQERMDDIGRNTNPLYINYILNQN